MTFDYLCPCGWHCETKTRTRRLQKVSWHQLWRPKCRATPKRFWALRVTGQMVLQTLRMEG